MPHRTEHPITWDGTDAGGLIYYPRYFHLFVVGLNDYFSPVTGHLMESFRRDGHALPAVDASASFTVTRARDDMQTTTGAVMVVLVDEAFESTSLTEPVRACVHERESGR